MNDLAQEYTRSMLKKELAKVLPKHQLFFKRMYSFPNGTKKPPDLEADINFVVDHMDANKLNWAIKQVQHTLDKLNTI